MSSQSNITTTSSSGAATTTHTTVSKDNNQKGKIPYRASRYPGALLMATGVGHIVVGLSMPLIRRPLWEAIKAGYFNQFKNYSTRRSNSLWFMFAGAQLMLASYLVDAYLFDHVKATKLVTKRKIKTSKGETLGTEESTEVVPVRAMRSDRKIPRTLGVWFVGLGAIGAAALPVSGFHLLIAQGAAILLTE